jgi:predicted transcriptional regulator
MTKVFNIRLTDEQHAKIKELADEYGETMTWIVIRSVNYVMEKRPNFETVSKRKRTEGESNLRNG